MPAIKFTDTFVKNAQNDTDKTVDYLATNQKGLHLRISPQGTKSFVLTYHSKITGKAANATMGRFPEIDLATAFEWAQEGLKQNARGQRVVFWHAKKNGGATVDEVFATYKADVLSQLKSGDIIGGSILAVIKRHNWGALPIIALDRAKIKEALIHMRDARKTVATANKMQTTIGTWLKWAASEQIIPVSPIAGMASLAPTSKPRERTLTAEDAKAKHEKVGDSGNGGCRRLHPFIQGLLDAVPNTPNPSEKPEWPVVDRVKWLQAAANIFDLIYQGEGEIKIEATVAPSSAPN